MEAVLAGVLGTKGAITDLGRISPVSSSGDSVSKSFGKKSPLREACDVLPSRHLQKKVAMIHPCGSAEMIHPCGSADKRQGCFQKETALPRGGRVELCLENWVSWGHNLLGHMATTVSFWLLDISLWDLRSNLQGITHAAAIVDTWKLRTTENEEHGG